MPWTATAAAYLAALLVLALLDAVWLGWLARDFYRREMGTLMADAVRWGPAALFYGLYPLALIVLALQPLPANWGTALWRSALVGALAYGAYDLTNLATLRGWSLRLTLVDMAWGAALSMAVGAAGYAVLLRWAR